MEYSLPIYIFQLPTLCKYGINCRYNLCHYSHPLERVHKKHPKYTYLQGKQNILFKCYSIMVKNYNNSITLQCFTNHFPNHNLNELLQIKYTGLSCNLLPSPYFLMENSLVLNHGADHLGGGVLHKGFVQEEIKTISSTLLGAFIACDGWDNLPSPMKQSLIRDPFVIRMEQFVDIPNLYATGGVLMAANNDIADQSIKRLPNPVKFDWLCMAFKRLKYTDGREYTFDLLKQMFVTSYKVFTIGIENALCDANGDINILIGNIGCGAFNHCIHVTYTIVILGLYCATLQFNKKINTYYCAYDDATSNEINSAFGCFEFINSCKNKGMTINEILYEIFYERQKDVKWKNKFV